VIVHIWTRDLSTFGSMWTHLYLGGAERRRGLWCRLRSAPRRLLWTSAAEQFSLSIMEAMCCCECVSFVQLPTCNKCLLLVVGL
jgi:hypothetical protein